MKKKIIAIATSMIALVLIVAAGLLINYNSKYPMVIKCTVNPSQVDNIRIYDHDNGYSNYTKEEIKSIVNFLNKINLKRGNYDKEYGNYIFMNTFKIELLDKNNKVLWDCLFVSKGKCQSYDRDSKYEGKVIEHNCLYYNGYFYPDLNSDINFDFFTKSTLMSAPYHKAIG